MKQQKVERTPNTHRNHAGNSTRFRNAQNIEG